MRFPQDLYVQEKRYVHRIARMLYFRMINQFSDDTDDTVHQHAQKIDLDEQKNSHIQGRVQFE